MRNLNDFMTSACSFLGITFSVQDINNVLNLILLIISVLNIIIMFVLRVIDKIKDGITKEEIKEILNDAEATAEEVQKLTERK